MPLSFPDSHPYSVLSITSNPPINRFSSIISQFQSINARMGQRASIFETLLLFSELMQFTQLAHDQENFDFLKQQMATAIHRAKCAQDCMYFNSNTTHPLLIQKVQETCFDILSTGSGIKFQL